MKLKTNTTSERIRFVKASCDKAPFDKNWAVAMRHYRAAVTAHAADNDDQANIELDSAIHGLTPWSGRSKFANSLLSKAWQKIVSLNN
jgi:hypothetical protein